MNIIHINKSDGGGGGAQQFAIDLAKEFNASLIVKHKNTNAPNSFQLSPNNYDSLFELGDKLLRKIGVSRSVKQLFFLNEEFNYLYEKLVKLEEYQKADIVHLHNIHGGYFDLKDVEKIAREKKIVWTLHDMWLMTGGEVYTIDHEGYKTGDAKTPYVHVAPLSKPLIDKRQTYLERKKQLFLKHSENIVLVPVSRWLEKCLRESYVYNDSIKIETIENGVDISTFFNKKKRDWAKPRLLFFNSKSLFKGSKYFHAIVDDISEEIDLYVVGDKLSTENDKINVKYFDFIADRDELADLYNQVDILIFPSIAENFPLTLLEAQACGVTVVGAKTGGIPEIINEENGYLFKSKDSSDLLRKLLKSIQDFKSGTLKKGESFVFSNFTYEDMVRKYKALYKDLTINK